MIRDNFILRVSVIPIALVTLLLAILQNVNAQTTYKLAPGKDVIINILGSSNVHNWTMTSSGIDSQGDFKFDEENQLLAISSFSFTVDAKSLKSGHESMDSRTYKAIKADLYPRILYKLHSAVITQVQKNKYLIKSLGDLTIAGVTQTIMMNVNVVVNPDNTINCTGFEKVKLSDYKIDVPRFMLGTLKVSNDLTIQYNFNSKKKSVVL
jgi:polyisoprenoid-binding protein YceI